MSTVTRESLPRILSGVQSSGKLHIGNYFGAIKQHIERQDKGDCFFFIADYHAMTTLKEAEEKEVAAAAKNKQLTPRPAREILRDNVSDVAIDYLALGLDPAKVAFFRQSDVPEVCELAWVLSTVSGMGLLERAHSYKDKVAKGFTPSVGLFTYPILMAADILIYRSHLVPVGRDQEQHLEMTRDIAGSFNHAFGEVFPLPEAVFNEAAIVPGTDGQKMSKSYGNTIDIFAEGKALERAVMGIVTDKTPLEAPLDPDTCNVFALYKLFASPPEQEELAAKYRAGGFGYGAAKKTLLAKIDAYFAPARERRKLLERNPGLVEEALTAGAQRARAVAQVTVRLVRERLGLNQRPV
ncbi:tryptophanyl-trna synthetase : Tryptophan--tRNA ligase OS=uncultured bacterium GN=trpS PE=3 SV=1: tRNA-synt_1b [Gemmataceae bacterium]|nr:tryptophanyl-trna synthetase : Tryptophan--tRNA ligase OS=uncultured bacterium GN=trpS PE=3 SV=1: tRNA-synt_1b [Gemmataceae bacterium]VTT97350.1 tryptophanyl-trna synthetase : Tryptophan--tRNA ligase OS=uncultured bacterium GN=trpS PE=3 SV=1: tRNA-synt_1b [Gemmataceae bacterium]